MKNSALFLCLVSFLLACSSPKIVAVWKDEKHLVDASKTHSYIYFVQSTNQLNSRIAQDRMVRLSSNASKQGYLYTKGDRINPGNREYYKSKMQQEGYDYVVIMHLVDSVSLNTQASKDEILSTRNFYSDYSLFVDPLAYNPNYEREVKPFVLETNVYFVETGSLVFTSQSKLYSANYFDKGMQESSEEAIQKLKHQGFLIK